ncbi:hypothetical protein HPB52_014735 [Rhipicephalus sanguineus]|uniref:Uncharacterized protein n=1 Tax=Rhipicephalus sanguineus TaxID=34632 RepID=A0A9D4Q0C4_RHISA|nr:hypothetical protein HPB52_014735 [Rhipicephalus sanguineus]
MSRDTYEDIAQNLTDKMKRTLTPANDGVFSKNCLGVVTAKDDVTEGTDDSGKGANYDGGGTHVVTPTPPTTPRKGR